MNLQTINREEKYYSRKIKKGTSYYYSCRLLNKGCLTFPVFMFRDNVYKEHGKPKDLPRRSSKIPNILFKRYKFGVLKTIN